MDGAAGVTVTRGPRGTCGLCFDLQEVSCVLLYCYPHNVQLLHGLDRYTNGCSRRFHYETEPDLKFLEVVDVKDDTPASEEHH